MATVLETDTSGDAEDPAGEVLGLIERRDVLKDADEGVLEGIIRGGPIAQHVADEPSDLRCVALVDGAQGGAIA